MKKALKNLHHRHVEGTLRGEIITDETIVLCHLTKCVARQVSTNSELPTKIYTTTRMLKHLYEKRTAEEYDFILKYTYRIVKMPSRIYKNHSGKRGDLIFVKSVNNFGYACSIEIANNRFFVVTCFRFTQERKQKNYLKNYNLLWSWRDDESSS